MWCLGWLSVLVSSAQLKVAMVAVAMALQHSISTGTMSIFTTGLLGVRSMTPGHGTHQRTHPALQRHGQPSMPWDHATRVVLWPNPLDSHQHEREGGFHPLLQVPQGNTSHQLMHFVSYVLGAAGEQRLPPGQLPVNTARRLQAALKTGYAAANLEEDTPNADEV
jgi:hypothetical protein